MLLHIDKSNWLKDTFAESQRVQDIIRQPIPNYHELSEAEKDQLRQTQIFTGEIIQVLGQHQDHSLIRKYDHTLGWVPTVSLRIDPALRSFVFSQGKTQTAEEFLKEWLGMTYVFGGLSKDGIDCSGLTQLYYLNVLGIRLPKNSFDQRKLGSSSAYEQLKDHDIVFCRPYKKLEAHHVALFYSGMLWHSRRTGGVICQGKEEFYKEYKIEEVRTAIMTRSDI